MHAFAERIETDLSGGVKSGVNGTPTFHINGTRHEGAFDFEALAEALENAV
jgi:protein-disulfide isomerase